MPLYRVKAATQEGKIIQREIEASSREDVLSAMEKEGLCLLELKPFGRGVSFIGGRRKVKRNDFLVFNKGLISLLKAGLPIIDALESLRSKSLALDGVIKDTVEGVRGGKSLSDAMEARSDAFSTLYIASVRAGEKTGDLVPSISSYVEYQKRMEELRKKVVSSLTYPAILTLASLCVIIFLMFYVIPTFSQIYISSKQELPLASRLLIGFSAFVKRYALVFLPLAAVVAFGCRAYLRTSSGRRRLDGIKLKIPPFSELYRSYAISKFSRTLSMVLKSGVHLVYALEMSKGVLDNAVLEEKLDTVIKKAKEGATVTSAMNDVGLMPDVILRMFGVGEKSASLPEILADASEYLDDEVDHRLRIMTNLIEPALMVIMGLIIGTIVILLYLPIFQLGERL
ncbi:MAG: type II secretion system F family protein [Deltaproteobacteria bacterium]